MGVSISSSGDERSFEDQDANISLGLFSQRREDIARDLRHSYLNLSPSVHLSSSITGGIKLEECANPWGGWVSGRRHFLLRLTSE